MVQVSRVKMRACLQSVSARIKPYLKGLSLRPLLCSFVFLNGLLLGMLSEHTWQKVAGLCLAAATVGLIRSRMYIVFVALPIVVSISLHGHFAGVSRTSPLRLTVMKGSHVLLEDAAHAYAVVRTETGRRMLAYGRAGQLRPGSVIETQAAPERPGQSRNPGGFSEADWIRQVGAREIIRLRPADAATDRYDPLSVLRRGIWRARKAVFGHLRAAFPDRISAWLAAFSGGGSKALPAFDRSALSALSLSHLTSVSGLHVSFLLLPLSGRSFRRRMSRRVRFWLRTVLMLWLLVLANAESGVARAVFMRAAGDGAARQGLAPDHVEEIAASGVLMLVLSPYRIFQTGFWLSVLAALSIRMFAGPAGKALKRLLPFVPDSLCGAIVVTSVAQLAVLPVLLWHNEAVSPIGIVANILLSFAAQGLTVLAVLSVTLLPLVSGVGLAGIFSFLLYPPVAFLTGMMDRAANIVLPSRWFWLPGASSPFALVFYGLAIALLAARLLRWRVRTRQRRPLQAALALSLCLTLLAPLARAQMAPPLTVWFLDVGQGDSMVLLFPDRRAWLIDGGMPGHGLNTIWPFMKALGLPSFERAIVTHAHADHAGGVLDLLKLGKIESLYMPAQNEPLPSSSQPESNGYGDEIDLTADVLDAAAGRGVPVRPLRGGDRFEKDAVTLDVLALTLADPDVNDASLQLYLRHESVAMLFASDATAKTEAAVNRLALGRISVLKVAHHGSRFTTGKPFVARLRPHIAVVSVGRNKYGHPSDEVLANLAAVGSLICRTDRSGAIRLRSDGKKVDVMTWLK